MTGKIRTVRADKGFGFVKDETGKEYFFHRSAVYGEGLEDLREGDSVEFDVGEGPRASSRERPTHLHIITACAVHRNEVVIASATCACYWASSIDAGLALLLRSRCGGTHVSWYATCSLDLPL